MKYIKINIKRKGLSLVEVLIAMSAFAIIFTGLASTYQATVVVNQAAYGLSECLRQYKDGMRLLMDGDRSNVDPHDGLMSARAARLCPDFDPGTGIVRGALEYTVGKNVYAVWVRDGKLLRMRFPISTPRLLMGEGLSAIPKRRIMLSENTTSANPFGTFATDEAALPYKTFVRMVIKLHSDFDNNGVPSADEAKLVMKPVILLRNAK